MNQPSVTTATIRRVKQIVLHFFFFFIFIQVDLALDVEKALPAMLRQRFATTQEEVYPNANKYWTIWSFWNQTISPARAIYEAMNPEEVGT